MSHARHSRVTAGFALVLAVLWPGASAMATAPAQPAPPPPSAAPATPAQPAAPPPPAAPAQPAAPPPPAAPAQPAAPPPPAAPAQPEAPPPPAAPATPAPAASPEPLAPAAAPLQPAAPPPPVPAAPAASAGAPPEALAAQPSPGPPPNQEKKPAIDPFGPRNAIRLRPLAFFGYGVSVQYERFILPRWLSLAGGIGYRYAGGGDYSGSTGSLSVHARFWLIGRSFFTKLGDRAMVGPYLELGETVSYTSLTDDLADRSIGSTTTLTESLLFGCRFNVGPFELSPALGLSVLTDVGHHLAAHTHVAPAFDGTIGWMF